MATTISITQKQKEQLIEAIRQGSAQPVQRFQAQLLLQGVKPSQEYSTYLSAFLADTESADLSSRERREAVAAMIQVHVKAKSEGGGSWFSWASGGGSSGGVGSAVGVEAARTLVEGLRPHLDKMFTLLGDIKPHLIDVMGQLKGDLKPKIEAGITHFMQRVGGKAKTPPEKWAQIIGQARALLADLHNGEAQKDADTIARNKKYKDELIAFVKELKKEAADRKACFSLQQGEGEALDAMLKTLSALKLEPRQDLTAYKREVTLQVATLDTPTSTPRPAPRPGSQAQAGGAKHPTDPLVKGIETLRVIDTRYVSVVQRIQHGIDMKPSEDVLKLETSLKSLKLRLNSVEEHQRLEGEDARPILDMPAFLSAVLDRPTLEEELKVPLREFRAKFLEEREVYLDPDDGARASPPAPELAPIHWTLYEGDTVAIDFTLGQDEAAQLIPDVAAALEAIEKIIQAEAGVRYLLSKQIGHGADVTQAYLHDHFLQARSDANLLAVYKALSLLHSFNTEHYAKELSRGEVKDLKDAKEAAIRLLERNNLVSFFPESAPRESRDRFREILTKIRDLNVPELVEGQETYELLPVLDVNFKESLFASSPEVRSKDMHLVTLALRVKGETVAGAVSRLWVDVTAKGKKEGAHLYDKVEERLKATIDRGVDSLADKLSDRLKGIVNETIFKVFVYSCAFVAFVIFASITGYAVHRRINLAPMAALS